MEKKLIIIGASGHGKVVANIAERLGYTNIVFLDSDTSKTTCASYPVVGTDSIVNELDGEVVVAIGNAAVRRRIQERISPDRMATLIHPDAVVARDAVIGEGTVVMAGVVINPNVTIGKGCIINTCASIDHDCFISDYVHISVGTHIAGTVNVGAATWVGIGATVSNNINITSDCMIGAGAVVVKDITEPGTYVGVPATRIK